MLIFFYEGLDSFFWLTRGREELVIDRNAMEVRFYRKGLKHFHKKTILIPAIKFFGYNDFNREFQILLDANRTSSQYGFTDGLLCIVFIVDQKNQRFEFGASLSAEEATQTLDIICKYLAAISPKTMSTN
ncbi:MAG: hypothetical protein IT258_12020 [Saprospiraceae bacterium]|nr:hypothetical protein [Saprospiraceae bacterium]